MDITLTIPYETGTYADAEDYFRTCEREGHAFLFVERGRKYASVTFDAWTSYLGTLGSARILTPSAQDAIRALIHPALMRRGLRAKATIGPEYVTTSPLFPNDAERIAQAIARSVSRPIFVRDPENPFVLIPTFDGKV